MRGKDISAFAVGTHILGGIIAGMIIGYIIDRFIGTSPWGMLIFLIIGIIAGFLNAYREMKKVLK